ncbi:DUF115 domain-containing protein [Heliobacterium gestii]|uniref:DUF115 domain-containing protein n=1 Tax=Heliomicrobium gestii TaxID=2699 RepID=A0A845LBT9_HELGE|nr:6-hydroxymethylpterin diphosphokinase MptE-like protein [Heliomicrobium gestii]MBM7866679.1 hypothetical protein [Heliomicrobium gestii]MZP43041.1 DUF115 domain-containing protein [Heliomicrobium gestii]
MQDALGEDLLLEMGRKNNWTLYHRATGRYLHSRFDPVAEAENWVSGHLGEEKPQRIGIYGFGLGYHVYAAARRFPGIPIDVFEIDPRPAGAAKALGLFEGEPSFRLHTGQGAESALGEWLETYDEKDAFWVHRPSLDLIPEARRRVSEILDSMLAIRMAYERFGSLMHQNWEQNQDTLRTQAGFRDFLADMGAHDTVLVAGAGPSLDLVMPFLPEWKKSAFLLAVGSAVGSLREHLCFPDGVVISDPQDFVMNQVIVYEDVVWPALLLLPTIHPRIFREYQGKKYVLAQEGLQYVEDWAKRRGEDTLPTGGSVITLALHVALKMGAKRIVFMGMDFAYTGGKKHAHQSPHMLYDALAKTDNCIMTQTNDGGVASTTRALTKFRRYVESLIRRRNDVDFINTGAGAVIEGARWVPTERVGELLKDDFAR